MKRFLLSTIFLTPALALASSSSAMAQAAAESVLLNSSSATTTLKAGTSLASVLNHVTKQLGGQVEQVTHPATVAIVPGKPQTVPNSLKNTFGAEESATASGPMITSIRGSEKLPEKLSEKPACAPANPPASTSDKASVQSTNTNCTPTPSDKPVPQKYKSVLTVAFPN
jgi:hypothetical protein